MRQKGCVLAIVTALCQAWVLGPAGTTAHAAAGAVRKGRIGAAAVVRGGSAPLGVSGFVLGPRADGKPNHGFLICACREDVPKGNYTHVSFLEAPLNIQDQVDEQSAPRSGQARGKCGPAQVLPARPSPPRSPLNPGPSPTSKE